MFLKIALSWCLEDEIPSICVWWWSNQDLWYLPQSQREQAELWEWPVHCAELWIPIDRNASGPILLHALYWVSKFGLVLHSGTAVTVSEWKGLRFGVFLFKKWFVLDMGFFEKSVIPEIKKDTVQKLGIWPQRDLGKISKTKWFSTYAPLLSEYLNVFCKWNLTTLEH